MQSRTHAIVHGVFRDFENTSRASTATKSGEKGLGLKIFPSSIRRSGIAIIRQAGWRSSTILRFRNGWISAVRRWPTPCNKWLDTRKSLNPEVAIEINPGGIDGQNRPWTSAVDHARILKFTECFWSEEDDMPAYLPDGRLISKIRTYKLARTYKNVLLTYTADNSVALAEGLAFNQTPGFVGSNPLQPETLRYIDFYRKHQGMYLGSEDITPVAVFRSYASLTYNNASTQLSAILIEQALIQSRIPFALIFDEHLRKSCRL